MFTTTISAGTACGAHSSRLLSGVAGAVFALATLLALQLALIAPGAAAAAGTERVSVRSSGAQGTDNSYTSSISGNGRYVAFVSTAPNLVSGDTNGVKDVFVHDRDSGDTYRVSVDSAGGQANAGSDSPSVSYNGRYIAFCSEATNLVAGDTNGKPDVFVHDVLTGVTQRASVSSAETQLWLYSDDARISSSGRFVVFAAATTDVEPHDWANRKSYVVVRDIVAGTTEVIPGTGAADFSNPVISSSGRYIAYAKWEEGAGSGEFGVTRYRHDRVTDATTAFGNYYSYDPENDLTLRYDMAIAGDGMRVAYNGRTSGYTSDPGYLLVADFVSHTHVYGVEGIMPSLSADGRFLAFTSESSGLVSGDTNGQWDIFRRDIAQGTTRRMSVSDSGAQSNGLSAYPSISANGRWITFTSEAGNLVSGDTNAKADAFVRDRGRMATKVSITVPSSPVAYRNPNAITGTLREDASNLSVANRTVSLYRSYDKESWKKVDSDTTDSNGRYSLSHRSSRNVYYRVRFSGSTTYGASRSSIKRVYVKVSLKKPGAPDEADVSDTFRSRGLLLPVHAEGSYPVKIRCYRYKKKADGSYGYVYVKSYSARASDYTSDTGTKYTRYTAYLTLNQTGKWRIRAVHPADSRNAKTYSSYEYFKVE